MSCRAAQVPAIWKILGNKPGRVRTSQMPTHMAAHGPELFVNLMQCDAICDLCIKRVERK